MSQRRGATDLVVGGLECLIMLAAAPIVRATYNRWGATDEELAASLPGDDLVPHPQLGYTRAITIAAPPKRVWPWLVQIGHGRGGLYTFDGLENLLGCQLHSADRILAEHQHLHPGDQIRSGPGSQPSWQVMVVDEERHLVVMGADPTTGKVPDRSREDVARSTWQWILRPHAEDATRLLVRQRLSYPQGQRLLWHLIEPLNFVMEREMLLGIARRAEST